MIKLSLFIFTILFYSHITYSKVPESTDPIVIIKNDWTSQIVFSEVVKNILEELGYKTEFKTLKTKDQWMNLARGWAHIQVEVWEGTMAEMLNRVLRDGNVLDAGDHSAKTREEWWYPTYMEEKCPGLPDWKALKKCAKIFSTKKTHPLGRYLGGPWEKPDAARVRALGLNFEIENVKNGDQLWVELEKAYKTKAPIILFNWTPNWVEDRFKGKFIEFPAYSPDCERKPEWGISKKWLYDCGNPKSGWLKKAVNKELESKWNCAFEIIKKIDLSGKMISQGAALVDADKLSYSEAAKKWMKLNQKSWKSWIPEKCSN